MSGDVDFQHPIFHTEGIEVVLITTKKGEEKLKKEIKPHSVVIEECNADEGSIYRTPLK